MFSRKEEQARALLLPPHGFGGGSGGSRESRAELGREGSAWIEGSASAGAAGKESIKARAQQDQDDAPPTTITAHRGQAEKPPASEGLGRRAGPELEPGGADRDPPGMKGRGRARQEAGVLTWSLSGTSLDKRRASTAEPVSLLSSRGGEFIAPPWAAPPSSRARLVAAPRRLVKPPSSWPSQGSASPPPPPQPLRSLWSPAFLWPGFLPSLQGGRQAPRAGQEAQGGFASRRRSQLAFSIAATAAVSSLGGSRSH